MDFSGKINLLGFKGAKLMTNLDERYPKMPYICIPVNWNDIELSSDGKYANAGVRMQETSEKYRQSCIQRRQMSGDSMEGYFPPSHTVDVSFSKDFRDKAMEAARKRIVSEHPEWQTNEDMQKPEFNQELKNAIYDAVRIRLGSLYARIRQQPQQPAASQPMGQQAQGAQQYVPTTTDPITGEPVQSYNPNDDDLPF